MTTQAMSEVIDALESKGYIKRDPAPESSADSPGDIDAQGSRGCSPSARKRSTQYEDSMLRDFDDRVSQVSFAELVKSAVRNLERRLPPG